jgi:hypothetical protein
VPVCCGNCGAEYGAAACGPNGWTCPACMYVSPCAGVCMGTIGTMDAESVPDDAAHDADAGVVTGYGSTCMPDGDCGSGLTCECSTTTTNPSMQPAHECLCR